MLIRRIALPLLIIPVLISSLIFSPLLAQSPRPSSSKAGQAAKGTANSLQSQPDSIGITGRLNLEEDHFRQADRLPITYLQRGRFSSVSILGMPPGFLDYRYGNNLLTNQATGMWNEQLIPIYQAARWQNAAYPYRVAADAPKPRKAKPESRIVFSQDYVIGLSYLDINFRRNTSATNFIQLSGSNFLGKGSESSDYSNFQVNTYRSQFHWQWGKNWQSDWYYWQMRHTYNLEPATGSKRDKMKQIAHVGWLHLRGKVGTSDSLSFTPGITLNRDRYFRGIDRVRKSRYLDYHAELSYLRQINRWSVGVKTFGSLFGHRADSLWSERSESDLRAELVISKSRGLFFLNSESGIEKHSESDAELTASLRAGVRVGRHRVSLHLFQQPKIVPMLWRTLNKAPFPAYSPTQLIRRKGAQGEIRLSFGQEDAIRVEPFWIAAQRLPFLRADSSGWDQIDVENYGIRLGIRKKIWRFILENDLNLSAKGGEIFMPEINNVASLKTGFFLFKRALKIEGIINWHYLGDYRTISVERLLYLYQITDESNGDYHLLDARLQARFRNATLFFTWDNLLSKDYYIVEKTLENFVVFRLGVDWFLSD